ncbi:MFS transporter [Prosthecobacter vanneervenii]|uniref:MFS family permease n=1 Tax=Prosthecobacter vanneervenii TaxID=48466 RepID=A0A7W7YF03_9BACT|nr:MFS transporter [Prosthecobacter vanneervenii]MBB5034904.1 MFS family permease [Prosthecobacter vanneervenii]
MRRAWLIVGLLFPVALLNYLDRQMIASMKVSVMGEIKDIGTEENWGHMLASFKWVYSICSPIGGYIADRFSRKYTICGSLFVWSLITWMTGHVGTFNELYWARTLMGISEAFYIPAALALIADYHIGGTRSRAIGVHQMGIYCGVMAGGFAGFVADAPALGWRFMFDFTGLAGVLYAIPLLLLLRDAPFQSEATSEAPKTNGATELVKFDWLLLFLLLVLGGTMLLICIVLLHGWAVPVVLFIAIAAIWGPRSVLGNLKELLLNRNFVLLVYYFTLPALAAWVVRDWMPAILQQAFNISQGKAGVSAALYWQGAALLSAVIGGWLTDRWMRRSHRGRIYVSAIGMMLIIPAMFGVGNAPALNSFALAIAALVLFGVGWGFFDCNNMPILSQIVRPHLRATGYGLMNFVSMMCGGLADWGFGRMSDMHVPLNVIFSVFAMVCVLSLVLVLMIRPKPGM